MNAQETWGSEKAKEGSGHRTQGPCRLNGLHWLWEQTPEMFLCVRLL